MKTPRYFANLMSAPPGIAPLRVPYAPFGQSRALPVEPAAPHQADWDGDDTGPVATPPRAERQAASPAPHELPAGQDAAAVPPAQAGPLTPPATPPSADCQPAPSPGSAAPAKALELPTLPGWKAPARAAGEWQVTAPVRHTAAPPAASPNAPVGVAASASAPASAAAFPPAAAAPTSDVPAHALHAALPQPRRGAPPAPAPSRLDQAAMQAPSPAPVEIDIEHIEVRVLPPAPAPRKEPANSRPAGPLLRFAPPFGLRQS